MKLKNAPGRKNQRRINALATLEMSLDFYTSSNRELEEVDTLRSKIVDPVTARNTRSKKNRE